MTVVSEASSLVKQGAHAAELLLDEGVRGGKRIVDPHKRPYADACIRGLAAGLANPRGWMRDVLEGTGRIARNLNVEPEHGFVELIQNADDVGAKTVRFALSQRRGREVIVVHDGARVGAPHVLAMTLALVSTKPGDAGAIGKFGIGLSTVTRVAHAFEVHCAPYHFKVIDQQLEQATPRKSIRHLYAVSHPETMLALALRPDYPDEGLHDWFASFGADSLLFMRSVRRIELRSERGELVDSRELKRRRTQTVPLVIGGRRQAVQELELRAACGATWWRLTVETETPTNIARTDKATPQHAPFAVAYSNRPSAGRLFAGLPLAVGGHLPFSLNALFDTDAPRTDLLTGDWNAWVVDQLTNLCVAGALHRLQVDPVSGWHAVPLREELDGLGNDWLAARLEALVAEVQDAVKTTARLPLDGDEVPLGSFWAEQQILEHLIDDDALVELVDAPVLLAHLRDPQSRWRMVLRQLEATKWLGIKSALTLFDVPDDRFVRDGDWCVQLIHLALDKEHAESLSQHRCLLLASGSRITPAAAAAQGLILGEATTETSLFAHHLQLIRPLHPAYLSGEPAATAIRQWLRREVGVRTAPSDEDALTALAGVAARPGKTLDRCSADTAASTSSHPTDKRARTLSTPSASGSR